MTMPILADFADSKPVHSSLNSRNVLACDFCAELSGRGESIFARLYAGLLASRVVARQNSFVALPTIGQVFPGSLLVLPEDHVETLASLPDHRQADLVQFVATLSNFMAVSRPLAAFEHGARAHTGGSCGIYHAHLHLVPLPKPVGLDEVLPCRRMHTGDLGAALRALRNSDQYLLFATDEGCGFLDIAGSSKPYPSQFFRRRLAEILKPDVSWDWRSIQAAEPDVISTVELFRQAYVPQQP